MRARISAIARRLTGRQGAPSKDAAELGVASRAMSDVCAGALAAVADDHGDTTGRSGILRARLVRQ